MPLTGNLPERSPAEQEAKRLESDSSASIAQRLDALQHEDPFIRQAAVAGLVQSGQLMTLVQDSNPSTWKARSSWQKIGLLTALRWQELANPGSVAASTRQQWIEWGLADEAQEVVIAALRWATERRMESHLETVRGLLDRPSLTPRTFAGVMASIAYLQSGSAAGGRRDPERERLLYEHARDEQHSATTRALAIRMLPAEAERPTSQELLDWAATNKDRQMGIEIVRMLAQRTDPTSVDALAKIASGETIPLPTRADAIASLAPHAGQYASLLNRLSLPREPKVLQEEVKRLSRRSWNREEDRPAHADLDAWESLVAQGGNADAGRRVFFRATCANCHAYQGRGATTGPDLSTLSGQMTARRLIESILQPSKEIGPLYVPWRVVTVDGRTLTGLKLDAPGVGQAARFQGADGLIFDVPLADIEQQEPIQQSIMPTGLEEIVSLQELRDLTAFLLGTSH
jgi:putative heme-binding domain-containing protein